MNSCMGEVQPAWPGGRDMGGWPACLLAELLVEGTICILAVYHIGYTLSGHIIMHSEIIIIWPLSVFYLFISLMIVHLLEVKFHGAGIFVCLAYFCIPSS